MGGLILLDPGAARARGQAVIDAQDEEERIENLHRVTFTPAQRPLVPEPPRPSADEQRRLARVEYKRLVRGTSMFRWGERRAIRTRAREQVGQRIEDQIQAASVNRDRQQREADAWWNRLVEGDPLTVLSVLNEALSDNEMASAAVGFRDGEASLVLVAPRLADTPTRYATLTPSGQPTTKAYNKTERNLLYARIVVAHVALTLKEAFAVAPSVVCARVAVIARDESTDELCILFAGLFDREQVKAFDGEDLIDAVNRADIRVNQTGRTSEMRPVALDEEPALRALLRLIEQADVHET